MLWILAALIPALLPATTFAARGYDPDVRYSTLKTPHFLVMFPEGYGHLALRTATIAEGARDYLGRRYGWQPAGRTSIVLNDQTDSANGSATLLPSKTVTLFVTAPTRVSGLEDYDDWLTLLLIHELAHIYHLDMAFGLPWVGRQIFGKYVAMNQYAPAWVTEGLAVYEETVSTGAGRGRSTYVDMVLRSAALEGRLPSLDRGYRGYPRWPFSNVAYFYGGRFQAWLAQRFGEEALFDYHRAYASNPVPYITLIPAKIAFAKSMPTLFGQFLDETREEASATLERVRTSTALPMTKPLRLTRHGGECVGPRVTPDGNHIVYSTSSPVDGSRVRRMRIDGREDEVLLDDTLSLGVSFSPDGRAFYLQQTEINQRFYSHNNLFRFDIDRRERERVVVDALSEVDWVAPSGALRAREPDLSPDGRRIVFVQTPYGSNRLVLAWLESDGLTIHAKVLVPASPDVQLSNPRFSPDGARIAVSRFAGGRRDIVVYDLEGTMVEEVTRDRAQDVDPTWSADGRWIVYASDRTGIYNLYAFDTISSETRQLTNLINGAFQPSLTPDGRTIVFRGYSSEGFDVYRIGFDPEGSPVVHYEKAPSLAVALDMTARRDPPMHQEAPKVPPPAPFMTTPMPESLPEGWSIGAYSALDTILPFNDNWNLFPALGANEREVFGALTHFGSDVLGTHSYAVTGTYGSFTKFFGGAASYAYDGLEPTFAFSGQAQAVTFGREVLIRQGADVPCEFDRDPREVGDGTVLCLGPHEGAYNQRRVAGTFSIGLPFRQRHFISLAYRMEHRSHLDPLPEGTIRERLPRGGRFARVSLGYSYGNTRRFPYSISSERGPAFGVALQGLSKGLGGEYEAFVLTTEGRYYWTLPWRGWLSNHVLAGRLGGGFTAGPDLAETFRLGGAAGRSAITTTTENFYPLRGLATSALRGSAVVSGSVEYRAPLLRIDRGIYTIPLTFQVVHAALFADAGRVFDRVTVSSLGRDLAQELGVGVGAELRADLILFYGLPLTLRGGYALAARHPSSAPPSIRRSGVYFEVGSQY